MHWAPSPPCVRRVGGESRAPRIGRWIGNGWAGLYVVYRLGGLDLNRRLLIVGLWVVQISLNHVRQILIGGRLVHDAVV